MGSWGCDVRDAHGPASVLQRRAKGNFIFLTSRPKPIIIQVMFRLIVTEKPHFPRIIGGEARELLSQLLMKNPDRRLGGGPADAEDIMYHPFFANINWLDLDRKRLVPPFKPELRDAQDTRYVDPEFAGDSSELTPPGSADCRTMVPGECLFFSEFSYQNPGSLHSRKSLLSASSRSLEIAV